MCHAVNIPMDVLCGEDFHELSKTPDGVQKITELLYDENDVETMARALAKVRHCAEKFNELYLSTKKSLANSEHPSEDYNYRDNPKFIELLNEVNAIKCYMVPFGIQGRRGIYFSRYIQYKNPKNTATIDAESVYNLYMIYIERCLSSMYEGLVCNFTSTYYGYDADAGDNPIVFIPPFKKEHFHRSLHHFLTEDPTGIAFYTDITTPRIDSQFYFERMFFKERA